jgi:DNA-binding GntR family transcriptional regulator
MDAGTRADARPDAPVRGAATSHAHGSTVDDIAGSITESILDGSIPTGEWLRQESIAARLGVSRQPVREALRLVESAGLVRIVPNRGAYVLVPSVRDVQEQHSLRAQLEGFAAELAAVLREQHHLESLRDSLRRYSGAVDAAETAESAVALTRANDAFHDTIVSAAGNARLAQAIADLHTAFPRTLVTRAFAADRESLTSSMQGHESVFAAIESRDPTLARLRMIQHVRTAGELIAEKGLESGAVRPDGSPEIPD